MSLHDAVLRATDTIQDGLQACEDECVRRTLQPFGGSHDGVAVDRWRTGVLARALTVTRNGEIVGRWTVSLVARGTNLVTLAVPS